MFLPEYTFQNHYGCIIFEMNNIEQLARARLLLMDVDGVLTDGSVIYTGEDMQSMIFSVRDGLGLKMIRDAGILTGVITGRKSAALSRRVRELGLDVCFDGVSRKGALLDRILDETGVSARETAFIGDDLPDIPVMRKVGIPIAVADARPEVKAVAAIITAAPGGKGAVREVCDGILQATGSWTDILNQLE